MALFFLPIYLHKRVIKTISCTMWNWPEMLYIIYILSLLLLHKTLFEQTSILLTYLPPNFVRMSFNYTHAPSHPHLDVCHWFVSSIKIFSCSLFKRNWLRGLSPWRRANYKKVPLKVIFHLKNKAALTRDTNLPSDHTPLAAGWGINCFSACQLA